MWYVISLIDNKVIFIYIFHYCKFLLPNNKSSSKARVLLLVTYNYKFPLEEKKIPSNCGSKR
ncbi:hypothetical protein RchiOBHm_Chr1g0356201 [Rosa chinensis]|uniref:Uncharacterized protein n=1 Tax=Rosa chinensis TaxID=74649 RepID=A0A2P6SHK1_ROSCH|nr:hypothetical protein RchiOBHm_Chr1g0356201 [Rosa chinensis]